MTREIEVFEGYWNDRLCCYGLTAEEARRRIMKSFWYGDSPNPDDTCFGTKWAQYSEDTGWRIVPKQVHAYEVTGEIRGDYRTGETAHLVWQCPKCARHFSEDYFADDSPPMLLSCTCGSHTERTYSFVHF